MKRMLASFVIMGFLLAAAPANAGTPVTLRTNIEVSGPAITLGDVFDGAGAASARAIAPAPAPGQVATLSPAVLAAAASAAGLDWSAAQGMSAVPVTRAGPHASGIRATLPAQSQTQLAGARSLPDAAVHRGETITLIYNVPGVMLSTRARALEDGAVGQDIRLLNLSSNRTIDATVTGPGAANAAPQ